MNALKCLLLTGAVALFAADTASADVYYYGYGPTVVTPAPAYYAPAPTYYAPAPVAYPAPVYATPVYAAPVYTTRSVIYSGPRIRVSRPATIRVRPLRGRVRVRF